MCGRVGVLTCGRMMVTRVQSPMAPFVAPRVLTDAMALTTRCSTWCAVRRTDSPC